MKLEERKAGRKKKGKENWFLYILHRKYTHFPSPRRDERIFRKKRIIFTNQKKKTDIK